MMSIALILSMIIGWFMAAYTVTQPHPVRAAFALIGVFCCVSVHWWHLQAPFLAILLLLVYLGAVMVFFLFIVMTLPQKKTPSGPIKFRSLLPPVLIAGITAPFLAYSLTQKGLHALESQQPILFREMGVELFEKYGALLQYLGILLFVAMVASVALISSQRSSHD